MNFDIVIVHVDVRQCLASRYFVLIGSGMLKGAITHAAGVRAILGLTVIIIYGGGG